MVIPAVALSTLFGALNGYVLTKWRFPGDNLVFTLMLLACFIPFQIVLIPMAKDPGRGSIGGHADRPRSCPHDLWYRFHDAVFPQLLRSLSNRARARRDDRRGKFLPDIPPHPAASSGPIIVVTVIWQFTNIWNDFLFGVSFADIYSMPVTVALNNLVSSSTGVKEYNVHFRRRPFWRRCPPSSFMSFRAAISSVA